MKLLYGNLLELALPYPPGTERSLRCWPCRGVHRCHGSKQAALKQVRGWSTIAPSHFSQNSSKRLRSTSGRSGCSPDLRRPFRKGALWTRKQFSTSLRPPARKRQGRINLTAARQLSTERAASSVQSQKNFDALRSLCYFYISNSTRGDPQ